MDGQELCRRIKGRNCDNPTYFILLTARDHQDDIVTGLESGADDYLIKPCEAKELLARVAAGLRTMSLQRELHSANANLQRALSQIDDELQNVAKIQRALLPQELPQVQGIEFAAFYRPSSQSGGDYYDVLPLPDGRLALVMADVSGHGTPAMVAMALARLLVHTHAAQSHTPGALLTTLNHLLFSHLPTDQYLTMFCGMFDAGTGHLQYSSAGHPSPLWSKSQEHKVVELEHCEGFPLKLVAANVEYPNWSITLAPEDRLLLFTDGVTDTMNVKSEMFELPALMQAVERYGDLTASESIAGIVRQIDSFSGDAAPYDDITIMEMRLTLQAVELP